MKQEIDRLLKMRKENKITESDYLMLSSALKKTSFCSNIENSIFINPFQKIAGFKVLIIGLMLIIIMSILGVYANLYYDGSIGFVIANNLKVPRAPSFLFLLYQNVVACLSVAGFFLLAAFLLRQKGIRAIDFLGTVTLARYPTCIAIIYILIDKKLCPEEFNQDISKGISLHFSVMGMIGALVFMACFILQIMTYFSALKESSGLEGKRLWSSFIIAMLAADLLSIVLTRLFLYS
jgi:hypothetical protein